MANDKTETKGVSHKLTLFASNVNLLDRSVVLRETEHSGCYLKEI